jgi:hypothetical protein
MRKEELNVAKPANVIEEAPNEDEIETPRVEVAAMKMDMP